MTVPCTPDNGPGPTVPTTATATTPSPRKIVLDRAGRLKLIARLPWQQATRPKLDEVQEAFDSLTGDERRAVVAYLGLDGSGDGSLRDVCRALRTTNKKAQVLLDSAVRFLSAAAETLALDRGTPPSPPAPAPTAAAPRINPLQPGESPIGGF